MNKCCIKSPDGWMIVINSVKLHMFYFYFRAILQSPRVSAHDVNPPDPVFVITMMERIKGGGGIEMPPTQSSRHLTSLQLVIRLSFTF